MKLVEVIKEGEIVRMSESQAMMEDLFILRKVIEEEPVKVNVDTSSLYKKKEEVKSSSFLEKWRSGSLLSYKKNNVIKDLVPNFNWQISMTRRKKNMTRAQLSKAIGCSEEEIKMIELGELPRDDFVLISKIENHLGLNLRKERKEEVSLAELQKKQEVKKEAEKVVDGKDVKSDKVNAVFGEEIEIID